MHTVVLVSWLFGWNQWRGPCLRPCARDDKYVSDRRTPQSSGFGGMTAVVLGLLVSP